jgi:hypothetical protein
MALILRKTIKEIKQSGLFKALANKKLVGLQLTKELSPFFLGFLLLYGRRKALS